MQITAKVNENLPTIDGSTLDNVVDYFTYVIIPALMIYWFSMVPSGWEIICSATILAASCYTFSNINQKTQDFFFRGFPALWNIVVLYFYIIETSEILLICLISYSSFNCSPPFKKKI